MSDVSCRITRDLIEFVESRGLDSSSLFGDNPCTNDQLTKTYLTNPVKRLDWNQFALFMDRFQHLAPDRNLGEDYVEQALKGNCNWSRSFKVAFNMVTSLPLLYKTSRWISTLNYSNLTSELEQFDKYRYRMTFHLRPGDQFSEPVAFMSGLILARIPLYIDLPEAIIETAHTSSKFEYNIKVAPPSGVLYPIRVKSKGYISPIRLFFSKELRSTFHQVLEARSRLEEETALRMNQLEVARQAAERANKAKTMFVANMSHEIRTPMTAILGFADMLRRDDLSPESRAKCIDVVHRNGNHLLNLLDDILDISKIEEGHVKRTDRSFKPRELIEDVIQQHRQAAADKNILLQSSVTCPTDFVVRQDVNKIRQVLVNLVGNAIKFTERGRIYLRLVTEECNSGEVNLIFEVHDTGCGIEREQQSKIFEAFSQSDMTASRQFGGAGLGLHLARSLAEILDGDLCLVESRVGRGSTFRLRLRAQTTTQVLEVMPKVHDISGVKILIVDDNEEIQFIITSLLTSKKAICCSAASGEDALKKIEEQCFDVIIMDLHMPGIDGFETTRRIRANACTIPVIALTASARQEDMEESLEAGCNTFLTKPIKEHHLVEHISQVLADSRQVKKDE